MDKLISRGLYSKQLNHLTTSKVLGISKIILFNILRLQLALIIEKEIYENT